MTKLSLILLCVALAASGRPALAQDDTGALEHAYWTMIRDQTHAAPFQGYLARFPNGPHADAARDRIAAMTPKRPPVASDPAPAQPAAPVTNDAALDLAFWTSIADSSNPDLFKAYLKQFPNGVFAAIARDKIAQAAPVPTPAPAPQAAVKPAAAQTPQDLYQQADAILVRAAQMDGPRQAETAAPAIKMLEQAARMNHAPSLMSLAYIHEAGLGVPQDFARAVTLYQQAGETGMTQGFVDAMQLADQVGLHSLVAPAFFAYYKAQPYEGRISLDQISRDARIAIQRFLSQQGIYDGALDGQFGPASIAAVDAYIYGSPAPSPSPTADLATALQTELKRVGCYRMAVDGAWGPGSAAALENFNHWTGSDLPTQEPTPEALNALKAQPAPVCGMD